MPTSDHTFTIFGAGLSGSLMSVLLAREGYKVRLYERRSDPRLSQLERGRSINLALSTRGIDALERAGLAEKVLADAIPMPGRMIHERDGRTIFQPYSARAGHAINSVSRNGLNITLIDAAAAQANVEIVFAKRCLSVDFESGRAMVVDEESGAEESIAFDHVIGADGAFSGVRSSMLIRDRFSYSQDYLTHGYKELTVPPAEGGGFRIDKGALHIWPRGSFMMIALPNADGSFTCTLFWPHEGPNSFSQLRGAAKIQAFFEENFADAAALIPDLVRDFQENPTSSLATVRCEPWNIGDQAILIGDAAHAVVPFYGQGMNASFEDCVWLLDDLKEHEGDIARAFESFAARRKPHADAIADMALANFIEMRDKTASPAFRAKKRLERILDRVFPESYTPLYEMVSFSTIPYADALARAKRQDDLIVRFAIGLIVAVALVIAVSAVFWLGNR